MYNWTTVSPLPARRNTPQACCSDVRASTPFAKGDASCHICVRSVLRVSLCMAAQRGGDRIHDHGALCGRAVRYGVSLSIRCAKAPTGGSQPLLGTPCAWFWASGVQLQLTLSCSHPDPTLLVPVFLVQGASCLGTRLCSADHHTVCHAPRGASRWS